MARLHRLVLDSNTIKRVIDVTSQQSAVAMSKVLADDSQQQVRAAMVVTAPSSTSRFIPVILSNTLSDDDAPLVQAIAQHQDCASVAPTPQRNKVSDFYRKVPTSEHVQNLDTMMKPDELDLRNIFKGGVAVGELVVHTMSCNVTECS